MLYIKRWRESDKPYAHVVIKFKLQDVLNKLNSTGREIMIDSMTVIEFFRPQTATKNQVLLVNSGDVTQNNILMHKYDYFHPN